MVAAPEVTLEPLLQRALGYLELTWRGRLEVPARGVVVNLFGDNRESLSRLLNDLKRSWNSPVPHHPEVARIYGENGDSARDPRTGSSCRD